jgi:hypothetical protein
MALTGILSRWMENVQKKVRSSAIGCTIGGGRMRDWESWLTSRFDTLRAVTPDIERPTLGIAGLIHLAGAWKVNVGFRVKALKSRRLVCDLHG